MAWDGGITNGVIILSLSLSLSLSRSLSLSLSLSLSRSRSRSTLELESGGNRGCSVIPVPMFGAFLEEGRVWPIGGIREVCCSWASRSRSLSRCSRSLSLSLSRWSRPEERTGETLTIERLFGPEPELRSITSVGSGGFDLGRLYSKSLATLLGLRVPWLGYPD